MHLTVFDAPDTLFPEKVTGRRSMPIVSRVGGRLPAHATASGKVFLALGPPSYLRHIVDGGLTRLTPKTITMPGLLCQALDRTLERGYGINREESEPGVAAVAAPVHDHAQRVIAAVSMRGPRTTSTWNDSSGGVPGAGRPSVTHRQRRSIRGIYRPKAADH